MKKTKKPREFRLQRTPSRKRPRKAYFVDCAQCGKRTDVPFKPTQGKPVYCKDCFDKRK